jgi:hypothetical protein
LFSDLRQPLEPSKMADRGRARPNFINKTLISNNKNNGQ